MPRYDDRYDRNYNRRAKVRWLSFGIAKVQEKPGRWQVVASVWGKPNLNRRIGPVFDRQWKAVQTAQHYSERRNDNLRRHGYSVW